MARGGGGLLGDGELPLNADINVTSLVDVAFVLLIIFMITAPIMQGGVDVRLPRAEAKPLEPKSGLVVTLDREGRIFMDQAPLSYADFRATFPAFVRTKRPTGVYLRADGRVPYADVVRVLAAIRAASACTATVPTSPTLVLSDPRGPRLTAGPLPARRRGQRRSHPTRGWPPAPARRPRRGPDRRLGGTPQWGVWFARRPERWPGNPHRTGALDP